jgi:hypothetical protein
MGERCNHLREWAELVGDTVPEAAFDDECGGADDPFGADPGGSSSPNSGRHSRRR